LNRECGTSGRIAPDVPVPLLLLYSSGERVSESHREDPILLHESKLPALAMATILFIVGTPSVSAECVSATLADEVYYSCSGVLTVIPREEARETGSVSGPEPPRSEQKPGGHDDTPATANEEISGPRLP
jgi:hypothetical protein